MGRRALGEIDEIASMRRSERRLISAEREHFAPELTNGLQHEESRFAVGLFLTPEQALVEKRRDPVEHASLLAAQRGDDRFGRVEGDPTREAGQTLKQRLLRLFEQLVAPVDRGAKSLVSFGLVISSPPVPEPCGLRRR